MWHEAKPRRYRDLTLLEIGRGSMLVISCDSSGGIGPKPADVIRVPAYVVGRFGVRVALMEVMSVGARPVAVIDTLAVEPHPTGAQIQRGISDEMVSIGLDPGLCLTGSMERNVPTVQTGFGITVLALLLEGEGLMGRLGPGDALACFGVPKVGPEVRLGDPDLAEPSTVRRLVDSGRAREVLPVGSRGIRREAAGLSALYGCRFKWGDTAGLDVERSAGPATCLLAAGDRADLIALGQCARKPFRILGEFVPP
ncbi:MAG: AIR synthase related protein [Bacillota bacterium]